MGTLPTILAWLMALILAAPALGQAAHRAVVITIDDEINEFTWRSFERRVEKARAMGADTLIVELDTPGGMVKAATDITRYLRNLSGVHTIAYINPRAYSAGTLIAVACDEIWMAPGSVIGDCGIITVRNGVMESLSDSDRAKISSPVVADIRDSASRNGYDPLLLESFVLIHRPLYYVENAAGQRKFINEDQHNALRLDKNWKDVQGIIQPVNPPDVYLTMASAQALGIGFAKGEAPNLEALAKARNLTIVARLTTSWGATVLDLLNTGVARGIILLLFLVTLYIALHVPGHGLPEAAAVLFFCVLVGVPLLTGYATWWEIGLIILGVLLVALEIFVFPTVGIMAVGGVALMFGGLLLTFVAPEPGRSPLSIPHLPATWLSLQSGLLAMVLSLASSILVCAWIRRFLPRLPYFNRVILNTTVGSESGMVGSLTNIDPAEERPAIGAAGVAITDLRPGGTAQFKDPAGNVHAVSVVSDTGYLPSGSAIIVRSIQGPTITVSVAGAAAVSEGLRETARIGGRVIEPLPAQIGEVGVAVSDLRPAGMCEFGGRRLEAFSEVGIIAAGTSVRVVSLDNRRPVVKAV